MPYISQHHSHFLALIVYKHVNKVSAKTARWDEPRYNLNISLEVSHPDHDEYVCEVMVI